MKYLEVKNGQPIKDVFYKINEYSYTESVKLKIDIDNYPFYVDNHVGNCKVCIIQRLQDKLLYGIEEKVIDRLNEVFTCMQKLVFLVTSTDTAVDGILSKHFKRIYSVKVPIGYYNGYQYHSAYLTNGRYVNREEYVTRIKSSAKK